MNEGEKLHITPEMLKDAKRHEKAHRQATDGEACLSSDTEQDSAQQEASNTEKDRIAREAIEKMKAILRAKDPEGMRPTVEDE